MFFNTFGRRLEEFKSLKEGEVRMYTCGPTVWNYPHIGNYRTFLFEDLLRRYLKYRGYKVIQVMNLTDVDDRIIKTCREQNLDIRELTQKYEKAFFEDIDYLGFESAEFYPRATDHIPGMIEIVARLLERGIAYKSEEGSIYFKISKFPDYGKLSGLKISELKPGGRVRQDDYDKASAQDFALWKAWDKNDGKIYWDTELGRGRPGWHIECSAMSMKYLGEQFDIHTGGVDLIFPHHENEIAQSEAYTGKKFANYWLHSEHLLINDEKMAKRLGNFITINDLKSRSNEGAVIRFSLLSGHYRAQLNFTDQSLEQSRASINRITEFTARLLEAQENVQSNAADTDSAIILVKKTRERYVSALDSDLDSPSAIAAFFDFVSEGNKLLDSKKVGREGGIAMLEFIKVDFNSIFAVLPSDIFEPRGLSEELLGLLKEREEARKNKDWDRSDSLRRKLAKAGIEVQDTPEGQKWRKKT